MKIVLLGNTKSHGVRRLREECERRHIPFAAVSLRDVVFSVRDNNVSFTTSSGDDLLAYDVFLFRGMGARIHECSVIARYLKHRGMLVIEDVLAERGPYVDKFTPIMVDEQIPTLDYMLLFGKEELATVSYALPCIVKSLDGSMGCEVALVHNKEELTTAAARFGFPLMLQEYVPTDHDYRVMVVDGTVLGALKRYTKEGDFLTTRSGGRREHVTLPQEAYDVALRSVQIAGLFVAGVDLIEHNGSFYRLEVNMSPGFRVFERETGVDVAGEIVMSIMRRFEQHGT